MQHGVGLGDPGERPLKIKLFRVEGDIDIGRWHGAPGGDRGVLRGERCRGGYRRPTHDRPVRGERLPDVRHKTQGTAPTGLQNVGGFVQLARVSWWFMVRPHP